MLGALGGFMIDPERRVGHADEAFAWDRLPTGSSSSSLAGLLAELLAEVRPGP